ncbi:MAG: LysE/ArgO family amino acid transporter [Bacteriovoracaceae bacterium]
MQGLFLEGFTLQASLIMALGAQNLFILESGLKRQNYILASIVCFLCDFTLIIIGVTGGGTLLNQYPYLKILIGIIGFIFLLYYGVSKIFFHKLVFEESSHIIDRSSIKKCILLAITFSVLNPHAYLDAFILIGGYSSKYSELSKRAFLGIGAASFSLFWFLLLSCISSQMRSLFTDQKKMKILMTISGCILISVAYNLGRDVLSWIGPGRAGNIVLKDLFDYPVSSHLLFSAIGYI